MTAARIILWTACSLGGVARLASAATFTLNPTQDAFVSSANPGANYGAAGALLVDAAGLPKGEFDSLLKFNLAGATSSFDATYGAGQWAIQSITLQLNNASPNNPIFNSAAAGQFTLSWLQNDSWAEGTGTPMAPTADGITYSTLANFRSGADQTLGIYSFNGATTGNNIWSLGLVGSFLADATAGNTVSLLALPADPNVSYTVNSANFTTVASRPVLTITAQGVPEPGTASLLAGGAALGLLRRRRHVRKA